jgi:hypothetical protein
VFTLCIEGIDTWLSWMAAGSGISLPSFAVSHSWFMKSQEHNPVFQQWLTAYLDRLVQVLHGGPYAETVNSQPPGDPSHPLPEAAQK